MVASRTVGSRRETFKTIALAHFDTVWPGSHVSLKQRRTVSCVITVNHPVVPLPVKRGNLNHVLSSLYGTQKEKGS